MSSRAQKNLNLLKESSNETHTHEDGDDQSSEAPSLDEAVRKEIIIDSDDSIRDPDFEQPGTSSGSESDEDVTIQIRQRHTTANREEQVIANNTNRARHNRGKKRAIKGDTRAVRQHRKKKRNTGQEYVNYKGKKELHAPCSLLNLAEISVEKIFLKKKDINFLLNIGLWEIIIEEQLMLLVYLKLREEQYQDPVRLSQIKKKLSNQSGITVVDGRGKSAPPNKRTLQDIESVRQHILSVPTYESHYTRRDSTKKYLPPYVTLTDLYNEYKQKYPVKPVSRFVYECVFHQLNISIKRPHKDTCEKCYKLSMQINLDPTNTTLKDELAQHHKLADLAYLSYLSKKKDKTVTKDDPERKTITFDLQQCLPTPVVQSSLAFYKRQLWTFNLTIHDSDTSQATCFVWHEAITKRGSDDIGSCLYKYLQEDLDVR
ncbi:unnamed protein product [Psylliodes chrysocephalus]|uniref:Uncharacterized protein n=1 Tax=Psylliodes chrysocephalus TaxID=3402493 RepID=A0A9P0D8S0_9CUCU|nr:unnamed protein product [Psylliodes chrysocephala]